MGYTQVALEDKILEMYPEIVGYGLSPRLSFDEDKNTWIIKFRKDHREFTSCIDKEDADACMDNTYCESFGAELKKILRQVEGKQSAKEINLQEEIGKVAYDLFDRSGRVEGRDLDNWFEAESIVMKRHRQADLDVKLPAKKTASKTKRSVSKKN
jgi:hypothetical protein